MRKRIWGAQFITPVIRGVFFVSMGIALNLYAAPAEDGDVFTLGEIVVTGERLVKESPTTISIVTADDISKQNAKDLGEALSLVPGVYFHHGRSKGEFYITLRGFEQTNVLILLDGVPIYQPYEGLVNLEDIPVQNIAEIKVIKGLSSPLYGANAMAGVINIITKKGSVEPSATLSYQVSDYNTHHLELSHGWTVGKLSYFIAASHKESDGFRMADDFYLPSDILHSMSIAPSSIPHEPIPHDAGKRLNSDYKRDAVTLSSNLDITQKNKLGLSFEYYNDEYGIAPVSIYRETRRSGGTAYYYPRYWRFDDWDRYVINLIDEYQVTDSLRLKFRGFYDDYTSALNAYDDSSYTTQDRDSGAPSFDSEYDDHNSGFNLYGFWQGISKNDIRFGFSYKRDVHEETSSLTDFRTRLVSGTYSSGLEDVITILDNLALSLGASYDVFKQKERHQETGGEMGDDLHSFSPQIGISWDISPALNLFASAGRKIRFPTMRNLYADGIIGPQGDPDLEEERSYSYELGGNWLINDNVTLKSALFYNNIRGLINFDNQSGRFEQYSKARTYGFEISTQAQIGSNLTAQLGYTYTKAENNGSIITIENEFLPDLVYVPDEIPYRPKHKFDIDLVQSFNFGMKVYVNGSYIADQVFYDRADLTNNTRFVATRTKLDDYFLLNTKVTYDFKEHYQVFIAVNNLLNKEYQELYLSPAPGRTGWLGLKFML
jgi:outer membrane receptor protein involved in Fe transport